MSIATIGHRIANDSCEFVDRDGYGITNNSGNSVVFSEVLHICAAHLNIKAGRSNLRAATTIMQRLRFAAVDNAPARFSEAKAPIQIFAEHEEPLVQPANL